MLPNVESRHDLFTMQPPRDPAPSRRPRLRESLDTLLLGALSTSIGLVLLIALLRGDRPAPGRGWNEKAITGKAPYYVTSKDCGIAAVAGVFLGLAGILRARRRHGTISPLSTLGTVICLGHIYLFFFYIALMELP